MRTLAISTGAAALISLAIAPAYAGQRGNSGSHGPTATTTATHGPSTGAHGPSTTSHGPSTSTNGPSTHATGAANKGTASASPKSPKAAASTTTTSSTSSGTTSTSTSTSGTSTGTTAINFAAGPVGQKLTTNTALNSKLATRLQAEGYKGTVYEAAYGFRNLGQFVAATNVSRNLGIPFEQLKLQMTGLTVKPDGTVLKADLGTDGSITMVPPDLATNPAPTKSLGQSIQTVKAGVDSTAAAQTATTQATAEIQSTSTTSTAPTTTTGTTSTTSTTVRKPKKS